MQPLFYCALSFPRGTYCHLVVGVPDADYFQQDCGKYCGAAEHDRISWFDKDYCAKREGIGQDKPVEMRIHLKHEGEQQVGQRQDKHRSEIRGESEQRAEGYRDTLSAVEFVPYWEYVPDHRSHHYRDKSQRFTAEPDEQEHWQESLEKVADERQRSAPESTVGVGIVCSGILVRRICGDVPAAEQIRKITCEKKPSGHVAEYRNNNGFQHSSLLSREYTCPIILTLILQYIMFFRKGQIPHFVQQILDIVHMSEKSGKLRIKNGTAGVPFFVWIVRSLFVTFNVDDVQVRADILEVLFGGDYCHDVEDSIAEEGDSQESHEQLSGVKHQYESEDTREYCEGDYQPPFLVAQPSGLDRSLELGDSVSEHVDSGGKADDRHGAAGVRQEDYAEGD